MNIVPLIVALGLGSLGAWAVWYWGERLDLLDVACERSSHVGVTPKGGGIGSLTAFVVLGLYYGIPFLFLASACIVSLVSFLGDRVELSPKLRLLIQLLCAFCIVVLINPDNNLVLMCAMPFLMVYVTGTANMYNFMDGINGIAAVTAIIAFGAMGVFLSLKAAVPVCYPMLSLGLAAASAGFLPYNFPKARVFMGDVGSVFLGFVFASIVVLSSTSRADFFCMTGFLIVFYTDELITMQLRVARGENLLLPHRKHVYQILVNEFGFPHWKITLVYGMIQVLCAILLILVADTGLAGLLMTEALLVIVLSLSAIFIRRKAGY